MIRSCLNDIKLKGVRELTVLIIIGVIGIFIFKMFVVTFSFCASIDLSMLMFTGHTLNLTSKFLHKLGLTKLAQMLKIETKVK